MNTIIPKDRKQLRFNKSKENDELSPDGGLYGSHSARKGYRIEKTPFKVLEAPALLDDYYLNLVSWGKQNFIAVGLEDSVYCFNFLNNNVSKHMALPRANESGTFNSENDLSTYVCALTFEDEGRSMAVSDSLGQIYITDVERSKVLGSSQAHSSRVGSLHWQDNVLVSGSRDKTVRLFDTRQRYCHPVFSFSGHSQEICGLKLSPDNCHIASGGNDNQLLLWDIRAMKLLGSLGEHDAAVKALAWNPSRKSILLSGAGTADRNLRVFDTAKCEQLAKIDTGSQVCNLSFDAEGEVLISTHGYSLNQLILWTPSQGMDSLTKEEVIIAHKLRVLYLAASPCGKYVATGAGDETIRVWRVVNQKRQRGPGDKSGLSKNVTCLR